MNYNHICGQVVALAKEVGAYLRDENKQLDSSGIESKGQNDFVTYVDKESERRLIEGLSAIFPEAGFLTEEGHVTLPDEEYFWVVDPLDGTSNYIHHLPPYAISIGLMKKNEVLLGVVYEVTLDEAFYAWKNGGAFLNGQPVRVSGISRLKNGMIAYGIPYRIEPQYDYLRKSIGRFYGLCTLRHLGSAAAELCYVASGRFDAYFHDNLSPWDVAAGTIIVREAGGTVTTLTGNDDYIFGKEMVASNNLIHNELLDFITC